MSVFVLALEQSYPPLKLHLSILLTTAPKRCLVLLLLSRGTGGLWHRRSVAQEVVCGTGLWRRWWSVAQVVVCGAGGGLWHRWWSVAQVVCGTGGLFHGSVMGLSHGSIP